MIVDAGQVVDVVPGVPVVEEGLGVGRRLRAGDRVGLWGVEGGGPLEQVGQRLVRIAARHAVGVAELGRVAARVVPGVAGVGGLDAGRVAGLVEDDAPT